MTSQHRRYNAHDALLTDDVRHRAALFVCDRAHDADDARMLLDALGLLEPAGSTLPLSDPFNGGFSAEPRGAVFDV